MSKTITAAAVVRLLQQRGLTEDAPILSWLPPEWSKGQSVNTLTFEDLMTHTPGLAVSEPGPPVGSDSPRSRPAEIR